MARSRMCLVTGKNIVIEQTAEDFDIIGGEDLTIDDTYSNTVNIRNGSLIVSDTDVVVATPLTAESFSGVFVDVASYKTANFTIDEDVDVYYVDTTGGNVDVNLTGFRNTITIIKTVAANSITFSTTGASTIEATTLTAKKHYAIIRYDTISDTFWGLP